MGFIIFVPTIRQSVFYYHPLGAVQRPCYKSATLYSIHYYRGAVDAFDGRVLATAIINSPIKAQELLNSGMIADITDK